jgi:thiamine biosynthesis protein ThiS
MTSQRIEINEEKSLRQLVSELRLEAAPVLLEVHGEVFYPDDERDKQLRTGDTVTVVWIVAGG